VRGAVSWGPECARGGECIGTGTGTGQRRLAARGWDARRFYAQLAWLLFTYTFSSSDYTTPHYTWVQENSRFNRHRVPRRLERPAHDDALHFIRHCVVSLRAH
jgi:hypothetical protein